ncbi:MAG: hypothetical protein WCB31_08955 [Nitrososphaeraceae archaeon]
MKNLSKYVIMAAGLVAISILVPNVQAQNNTEISSNQGQPQTASNETMSLMSLNIGELKDSLVNAKDAVSTGNFENAMTEVTNVENQLLLVKGEQPPFVSDIQAIKESIGNSDVPKTLDGITNIQIELLKAETDMMKANQGNPQMMMGQNANNDNNQQNDNDNQQNDDDDNEDKN